jgi:uncharacterized protein involved in exopolysaccharide biosynthesis/CheY-like chemotaxis protein
MTTKTTTKKILIADPSEEFRHSLSQFLNEKGFEVIDVPDGSRALSETLRKRPDLLLLDLSIGLLGAERVAQIIRTNPNTTGIPIFFMSEQERSVTGARPGMDDFIRKPFHRDELLLRIQQTLHKDDIADPRAGDSEISGNQVKMSILDQWQMPSRLRDPSPDEYTIGDYWFAIYRRKWSIYCVLASALVTSALFSFLIPPKYEARAVFYVPDDASSSTEISGREIGRARTPSGDMDKAKGYTGVIKGNDAREFIHGRFPGKSVDELDRDVDFSVGREGLIRVYVRDGNPKLAADVANAYVGYFNEFITRASDDDLEVSLSRMGLETKEADQKLLQAMEARREFQEKHSISSIQTEKEELERQRLKFQENLKSAMIDGQTIAQQLKSMESQRNAESLLYREGEFALKTNVIDSLQETISQLEVELAGKSSYYKPSHPEIVSLNKKLAAAKEGLKNEIGQAILSKTKRPDSLHEDLRRRLTIHLADKKATEAKVGALKKVLGEIEQKIQQIPAILAESDRMDETVKQYTVSKQTLETSRENLRAGALRFKRFGILVETAKPPRNPVFPIWWLNIAVAALVGLLAGIMYALLLENIDTRRRMRRLEEAEMQEWARELAR